MSKKYKLLRSVGSLKAGTIFTQYGSVFCTPETCFMADIFIGNPDFKEIEDIQSIDKKKLV